MYFSERFGIQNPEQYDWFDPILEADTQLFVDPFQIFKEPEESPWGSAHGEIIAYFQVAFEMLSGHHKNKSSLQYGKTLRLMEFPEPREFGLGFVTEGQNGAGTGKGFARLMVTAMSDAIELGLADLVHFEELGLLVGRIGRDRISDITCNILKPRLIEYTQQTCEDLGIPCSDLKVEHSIFDDMRKRWLTGTFRLPLNPVSGRAVILVPRRFLRELPALNAVDWWEYVEPDLRDDLNLHISGKLNKEDILRLARSNTERVRQWSSQSESKPADPYPIDRDPVGLHSWQARTSDIADRYPLPLASVESKEDLIAFVEKVVLEFTHVVEEQGLWRLLYNDDSGFPKRELAIQLLFKGVVQSYCKAYGIVIDREVELGKGPADFILTKDVNVRLVLEIKKVSNGKFWEGLEHQLTSYMNSGECQNGWFLAVRFGNTKTQRDRCAKLAGATSVLARSTGFNIHSSIVDARPRASASNITDENQGIDATVLDPEFDE
ncbi:hypothetical protein [Amycolatopsis vastitatis]|uniref:hypothetical protein n=1 Tax=Amycolatopsis vastitatis TaxID=1905142 RepID=UPI001177E07E|nr:hypothetical protein [Amycolatopsis vastitatis]